MLPIFDEYTYATDMNNGHSDDRNQEDKRLYNFRDLVVYAKWLRWSLWAAEGDADIKDRKVYNGLVTFCDQLLLHFNLDVDYRMINGVIQKSKEFKLRSCNPSYITFNEWQQILMLPDDLSRRTYFALLVLCKFNRNNPILKVNQDPKEYSDTRFKISYSLKDIYKYGGVKFGRKELEDNKNIIYQPILTLSQMGLIKSYFGKKKCTFVLLNADVDFDESDIYLKINHYENIEAYYHYAMKEDQYKICKNCGDAFKDNKRSNRKYCKKCADTNSIDYIYRHCVDCGKRIRVGKHNSKTMRCRECQKKHVRSYDKQRKTQIVSGIDET